MIILSGVLVVLAIALLVTGIVTGNTGHEILGLDGLKLIYVSIGVSIVSALFLAVGVFLRRKELFGSTVSPASAKASAGRTSARPVKAKARVGAGEDTPMIPATSATVTDVPAETTVYVVPGRKRYHLETCRQLAGREKEELTFVEAREEGFTACTACLPDTALAARAAFHNTEPADDRPSETDTRPQQTALDPVEETRIDIPVTREPLPEEQPSADAKDTAMAGDRSTADAPVTEAAEADTTTVEPTIAEPVTTDTLEVPAETPKRRGRSLFEPLERTAESTETESAADAATTTGQAEQVEQVDAEPAPEPAGSADDEKDGEKTYAGSGETGHRAEPEDTRSEDERETLEPDDDLQTDADQARSEGGEDAESLRPEAAEPDDTSVVTTDEPEGESTPPGEHDEAASEAAAPADTDTTAADEAGVTEEDGTATDDATAADTAEPTTDSSAHAEPAADTESSADEPDAGANTDRESADAGEGEADPAAEAESSAALTVRILSGTKRYHRPDCALIEGIADDADDLESLSRAEAKERGCTPCLVCQPDD